MWSILSLLMGNLVHIVRHLVMQTVSSRLTCTRLYVVLTKSYTSYKESLEPEADVVSFSV